MFSYFTLMCYVIEQFQKPTVILGFQTHTLSSSRPLSVLSLSFLEHSSLLFHKTTAVLRWWSPLCSWSLAFSQSQERKTATMFFQLLFDFELFGGLCVSYNFKRNMMQNPQKKLTKNLKIYLFCKKGMLEEAHNWSGLNSLFGEAMDLFTTIYNHIIV